MEPCLAGETPGPNKAHAAPERFLTNSMRPARNSAHLRRGIGLSRINRIWRTARSGAASWRPRSGELALLAPSRSGGEVAQSADIGQDVGEPGHGGADPGQLERIGGSQRLLPLLVGVSVQQAGGHSQ